MILCVDSLDWISKVGIGCESQVSKSDIVVFWNTIPLCVLAFLSIDRDAGEEIDQAISTLLMEKVAEMKIK